MAVFHSGRLLAAIYDARKQRLCHLGPLVKTPLSAVATTQVVTSPSESKDGRKEVGGRVGEEKKDKQKSDGREKEAEKRNGREKSSKKGEQKKNSVEKEKDNRESKKRDEKDKQKQKEVEKVEDDKEEGSRKAQNPIVTPVSDEEEVALSFSSYVFTAYFRRNKLQIPAKNENKRKDVPQVAAMNPTQEEENENKETEETQATGP
uniref:Uncharacterized protein n=1 Tax=Setaria digitata TaxID=48799 RepID=A0A915PI24_9BILA